MDFKVGDKVKIISNKVQSDLNIGHVGTIIKVCKDSTSIHGKWVIITYPGGFSWDQENNVIKNARAIWISHLQKVSVKTSHLPEFL